MTVPDFQSMMLPIITLASDGKEHTASETIEHLAGQFALTEGDRREMLPSGIQPKFDNRVRWAITYLSKAGLLQRTGRAKFRITDEGRRALADNPGRIDIKYLKRYPSVVEFMKVSDSGDKAKSELVEVPTQTPEEVLEASYQQLRQNLAKELLDRVKSCPPAFFERLVVDLLVSMGYGGSRKDAGQAVGRSGDGGIDGIIKQDKLGLDVVYVQAKKWEGTVGRPVVQSFSGSLDGQRAKRGVLITTSQFSPEAKDYVSKIDKKIVLIDGEQLAQLMIEHGIGVTEVASFTVKKVDSDYFGE